MLTWRWHGLAHDRGHVCDAIAWDNDGTMLRQGLREPATFLDTVRAVLLN